LNFNQLSGTLTSYIGQLTALNVLCVLSSLSDSFHLSWIAQVMETNQFNGTIPKQIAQLTALTLLCDAELAYDFRASLTPSRAPCYRALSDNQFNGTIPTQIAQLTALTYLYVAIVRGGVSCSFFAGICPLINCPAQFRHNLRN
jgi:hypothetical protein